MKRSVTLVLAVVCFLGMVGVSWGAVMGTATTYQGRLSNGGVPAEGEYDLQFKLFDDPTGPGQVGSTITKESVTVDAGTFTVQLDFDGGAFAGEARWLEIGVRPGELADPNAYTWLSPRQEITPTPYALYALSGPGSTGFWAADGNHIYNTNSANVGIGITAPGSKLAVNDANNSDDELMVRSGTPSSIEGSAAILFQAANSGGTNEAAGKIELIPSTAAGNAKGGDLLFYTRNDAGTIGEKVRIKNNGNVGIGPMTPVTPLSVDTNTQFDPGDYRDRRLGSLLLTLSSGEEGLYEYGPALSFSGINTGRRRAAIASVQTSDDRDQVGLAFFTHWGWLSAYDDVHQAMLINHEGNVSIGETSPVTRLNVVTNTQFDPGDYRDQRLGSLMLTLIGGEEGLYKYGPALSFSGINTARRRAAIASVQTSSDHDQVGLAFFTYPSTNTAYDNVHQAMLINHAGNVGIGTDAHDGRLSIASGRTDEAYISLNPGGTAANDIMGVRVSESGNNTTKMHFGREFTVDSAFLDFVTMDGVGRVGIGTTNPQTPLDVAGRTRTEVLEITGGSDLAESFDVNEEAFEAEPGMVVCIDAETPGKLKISRKAYDRCVAGIISGAKGIKTGMMMGQKNTVTDGEHPVALTGRVYCWADASNGSIEPGDMLTTSTTAGHAMKVTNYDQAHGAVIGKAMTRLSQGKGLVLVLVQPH